MKNELIPPHDGFVLVDEMQEEYEDFFLYIDDSGCTCFLGHPPCSWCTHPGNPHNLNEDEGSWKDGNELRAEVRRVMEGVKSEAA